MKVSDVIQVKLRIKVDVSVGGKIQEKVCARKRLYLESC